MNRLTARKLLWFAALATAFLAALFVVVPTGVLTEVLNGVFLGLFGAVCVVFAPLFFRAVRAKDFDRVSQLTIGIALSLNSLLISRGLSVAARSGMDVNMLRDSPFVALAAYLAILGAVLHVTAPGMVERRFVHHRRLLLAAFAVGAAIATATILLQRTGT